MNRDYRSLELDKVLEMLAGETGCEDAALLARQLELADNLSEARRLMQETGDAYQLMARF